MAEGILREWVLLSEAVKREFELVRDHGFAERRVRGRMQSGEWPVRWLDRDGKLQDGGWPDNFCDQAQFDFGAASAVLAEGPTLITGRTIIPSWPAFEAYRIEVLVPVAAEPDRVAPVNSAAAKPRKLPRMQQVALDAINEVFPNGWKGRLPADVIKKASDWLKEQGSTVPSRSTFERAMGLRKHGK